MKPDMEPPFRRADELLRAGLAGPALRLDLLQVEHTPRDSGLVFDGSADPRGQIARANVTMPSEVYAGIRGAALSRTASCNESPIGRHRVRRSDEVHLGL